MGHLLHQNKNQTKMQKTPAEDSPMNPPPPLPPLYSSILSHLRFFTLLFSAIVLYSSAFCYISHLYIIHRPMPFSGDHSNKTREKQLPFAIGEGDGECDMFSGKWVRDDSPPPYEESECPYIGGQLTCLAHGRPEKDYQNWRWQPHGCSIPSFNATMMLEELRGKRMIFVGDSLNRGQFSSLICLLQPYIPQHAQSIQTIGSLTVFTAKDYNATIEYYWTPFLVESNADDPRMHKVDNRIIRNAPIGERGRYWKGADIIIFNSYTWWAEGVNLLLRGSSFQDENKEIVNKASIDYSYRIAIKMLIRWINENVDPYKTRLFFMGFSASHQRSTKWGGAPNGNCYNETKMIEDPSYVFPDLSLYSIIEEEFKKSAVPIALLNITALTIPRKDAHTSIYKAFRQPLTPSQLANPVPHADCIHWCLPGIQDDWNHLLYAKLFFP